MSEQDQNAPLAACIDIGGTKALIGLVDAQGAVLASERFAVASGIAPEELVAMLAARMRELAGRASAPWARIVGLGYSTAGMMDVESGVIFASPNQGGWRDVPFKALLREAFGLPAWIEMDANAAALGEAWLGAGAGVQDFIYVVVGTGVGAGILSRGEVLRGWRGTAGEFGHTVIDPNGPLCNCGGYGCLESLASGPAVAQRASAALQRGAPSRMAASAVEGRVTTAQVFEAARMGDALACEVVSDTVRWLAVGLTNLVHLLNPRAIALGGGVAAGGADLLIEPLREAVLRRCGSWVDRENLTIELSRLGDRAGLLGAAALVWRGQAGWGKR
jgi:glucokinase